MGWSTGFSPRQIHVRRLRGREDGGERANANSVQVMGKKDTGHDRTREKTGFTAGIRHEPRSKKKGPRQRQKLIGVRDVGKQNAA